jgi:tetratricopeptide (TPR) repeat protein
MDTVMSMPRPEDPIALQQLVDAQQLLNGRIVGDDECEQAIELLEGLGASKDDGGWDYFPAFLTLGSLYGSGFEPVLERDPLKAVHHILRFLLDDRAHTIDAGILQDASMQLGALVKDADLTAKEWDQLDSISSGNGAGQVASVAAWARFASMERTKQDENKKESAEKQQRRLEQEARKQTMITGMKKIYADTMPRVEEARRQGNDAYRQGNLPGNADYRRYMTQAAEKYDLAASMISSCISKCLLLEEESVEMKNQRGVLHSNAAQTQIVLENWEQAANHARKALEDDPENSKSQYRLAKALVELNDWEAAAQATDTALVKIGTAENVAQQRYDLWALADIVHKNLPTWKWTLAQPKVREAKYTQDYEKRIVGAWKYHGGQYFIKLEPTGALIFQEDTFKVDLIQQSMLAWSGEFELISGMKINLRYEPGADQIETQMIPPEEELALDENQKSPDQYKGPMKFWASRVGPMPTEQKKEEEEKENENIIQDWIEEVKVKEPRPKPAPVAAQATPLPATPPPPDIKAPQELWLLGHSGKHDKINGRYVLLEGELQNSRPVYRKDCESELFLWYRGGNWGVTESLNNSSFSAPFLSRCADSNGRAMHPLEMSRQLWHVRAGRGKEDADRQVMVSDRDSSNDATGQKSISETSLPKDHQHNSQVENEPPPVVVLSGRVGKGSEVNGRYELSSQFLNGRPVYDHEIEQLRLFHANGFWAVGARNFESTRPPANLARCQSDASHPLRICAFWEFLQREDDQGHMVSLNTRVYAVDRSVVARDSESVPEGSPEVAEVPAAECRPVAEIVQRSSDNGGYPAKDSESIANSIFAAPSAKESLSWVLSSSAEMEGDQVKAQVTVKEGVNGSDLSLDVAACVLRIAHGKEVLELALPVPVDSTAVPSAKWSKKTRTLTTRLEIQRG